MAGTAFSYTVGSNNYLVMNKVLLLIIIGLTLFGCSNHNVDSLKEAEKRYPMLQRCTLEESKEEILCGTFEVFENREEKGKKSPLMFISFLATILILMAKYLLNIQVGLVIQMRHLILTT